MEKKTETRKQESRHLYRNPVHATLKLPDKSIQDEVGIIVDVVDADGKLLLQGVYSPKDFENLVGMYLQTRGYRSMVVAEE